MEKPHTFTSEEQTTVGFSTPTTFESDKQPPKKSKEPKSSSGGSPQPISHEALLTSNRLLAAEVGRLSNIEQKLRKRQEWLEGRVNSLELTINRMLAGVAARTEEAQS
jgi:hypothetical protein